MNKRPFFIKRMASVGYDFIYLYVSRRKVMAVFEFPSTPRQLVYALMFTGFVLSVKVKVKAGFVLSVCLRRHKSKCFDEYVT
jgi:hypothetical protein